MSYIYVRATVAVCSGIFFCERSITVVDVKWTNWEFTLGNFSRGTWDKRKKKKGKIIFQGLRRHFRYGSLKVSNVWFIFCPMKCLLQRRHHERYSSKHTENRLIRTIWCRAFEDVKISSIRWSMWNINRRPQYQLSTWPKDASLSRRKCNEHVVFICIPQRSLHFRPFLPAVSPCPVFSSFQVRFFLGGGRCRCHSNSSNTLQQ